MKPPRKSKTETTTIGGGLIGGGDGFEDGQATFKHQSLSDARFDESVELMRSFALIDNPAARRKVIELARLLAGEQT